MGSMDLRLVRCVTRGTFYNHAHKTLSYEQEVYCFTISHLPALCLTMKRILLYSLYHVSQKGCLAL